MIAPLGAGGMGEVYLAEDLRLRRRVALKILPAGVEGEDARRRLLREARAAASLDHANICTVYDVGDADGCSFIAMQFVEGETLAARMTRGRLPLSEALAIASQIAAALAAAHAHGIVHRDIKPQNVMLTRAGQVKVLDFGLAKLVAPAGEMEPTATNLTAALTIAGTVPYMSPEQLRGEPIDARSDIFSFGVLLYELVSGLHPFVRPSSAETMSAILIGDPPTLEARTAPGALPRILRRLLEKDRERRYQNIADVATDLMELEGVAAAPRPPRPRWTVPAIVAAAAIVIASAAYWLSTPRARGPLTGNDLVRLTDFAEPVTAPALSRDGKMVAFLRDSDWFLGTGDIFVKALPDGDAVQLTHDRRPKYGLAFSWDASRVTYTAIDNAENGGSWDTWSVPVVGGTPVRFLSNAAGLSWLDEGHVLFSEMAGAGLQMGIVSASLDRSSQRRIYLPIHERAMAHYSSASPDRRWVLVVEMDGTGNWQRCRVVPFDGSNAGRQVGPDGACIAAAWAPDGRTMYFDVEVSGGTHLWQQRFPDGGAVQLTADGATSERGLAIGGDGRSLVTAVGQTKESLWLHEPSGERLVPAEGAVRAPRVSADRRHLYCLVERKAGDPARLAMIDIASGRTTPLLAEFAIAEYDISTDGQQVVFSTVHDAVREVWLASLSGAFAPRRLAISADQPLFGPDGDVFFRSLSERRNYAERIHAADGGGRRRVAAMPIVDLHVVSPDGRWIVVQTGGERQGKSGTVAIDVTTGLASALCSQPCAIAWAPNGHWLYVRGVADTTTSVIPLGAGQVWPDGTFTPEQEGLQPRQWRTLRSARTIPESAVEPSDDPSAYVFHRFSEVRNLYRVPLR